MNPLEYAIKRARLLSASAWNAWVARRGYNPTAGETRKANQREMAELRASLQVSREPTAA